MSVGLPFANTFSFARPTIAPYRNAAGAIVDAAVNEARFDRDADGNRLGMLIGKGVRYGQHDRLTALPGDWENARKATVLFLFSDENGLSRRALYTTSLRASINACLNIVGHLKFIGAVPAFLPNLGADFEGYCRYRNENWQLGNSLSSDGEAVFVDSLGKPLLESA